VDFSSHSGFYILKASRRIPRGFFLSIAVENSYNSYAYAGNNLQKMIMIFCFSDNERALQVLNEKQIHALDYRAFGMLEAAA
jgi:hypothetical protein